MIGITVLLLAAGLLTAILWLSMGFDRKTYNYYITYMHESVSGLSEDSAVKFNGVKVGFVSRISLSQIDPQRVRILLKIEEGTPITTSTYATLVTQGVTGNTFLGLSADTSSFIPLKKHPGDKYPVIPSRASFLSLLEKNVDQISSGFKRFLTKSNADNIHAAIVNLRKLTDAFAKNDRNLDDSLKQLPELIKELKGLGKEITITLKGAQTGIDKLSENVLPSITTLIRKIDGIADNVDEVTDQMRQNPAVIVRGTKTPKPGPGE